MSVIFLLIGISICVAFIFLLAFFWATKTNQFEDDVTPAMRILFEDEAAKEESTTEKSDIHGNGTV